MQTETTVEPEVATEPEMTVVEERPVTVPKYRYGQILPHEVWAFSECIKDCCQIRRSDYTDLDHANYMQVIVRDLGSNPYSLFIGCVDGEGKPRGYIWLKVDHDIYRNEPYLDVMHDYIVSEIRETLAGARVHRNLLAHGVEVMNRCNCKYIKIAVPNKRLFDSRKKLGFEALSANMIFRGTAQEFRERNPIFKNKGSEVENDG